MLFAGFVWLKRVQQGLKASIRIAYLFGVSGRRYLGPPHPLSCVSNGLGGAFEAIAVGCLNIFIPLMAALLHLIGMVCSKCSLCSHAALA